MQDLDPRVRPVPPDYLDASELGADAELRALADLAAAGVPLAPLIVVPSAFEERFYRWNNLPDQLVRVFQDVDPRDPDEDDVEEAAPEAAALVAQHYLLDEFVDAFYDAIAALPDRLTVRRSGGHGAEEVAARGRPTLLAVKHAFQRDWSVDAVMERLGRGASIALEARALVVQPAEEERAPDTLERRAAEVLGRPVRLRVARSGGVTRVLDGTADD